MARKNKNWKKKKRSKYTEQEKFAYRYGQVQRGLKNPNSRIAESFNNGQKVREKKARKSLY